MKKTISILIASLFISNVALADDTAKVTEPATDAKVEETVQISQPIISNTINIVEGVDYEVLATPITTSSGNKIEVNEYFWYGCPHCFALEDDVLNWKKTIPSNANYVATPAPLKGNWEKHARVYYALAALKKIDELHQEVFDAIHVRNQRLNSDSDILDFVEEHGIDRDEFKAAMNSFTVDSQITHAYNEFKKAQLRGVPNVIVAGKYLTNPRLAGGDDKVFAIVDALIQKAASE